MRITPRNLCKASIALERHDRGDESESLGFAVAIRREPIAAEKLPETVLYSDVP
jgi:hypothetical protein